MKVLDIHGKETWEEFVQRAKRDNYPRESFVRIARWLFPAASPAMVHDGAIIIEKNWNPKGYLKRV